MPRVLMHGNVLGFPGQGRCSRGPRLAVVSRQLPYISLSIQRIEGSGFCNLTIMSSVGHRVSYITDCTLLHCRWRDASSEIAGRVNVAKQRMVRHHPLTVGGDNKDKV